MARRRWLLVALLGLALAIVIGALWIGPSAVGNGRRTVGSVSGSGTPRAARGARDAVVDIDWLAQAGAPARHVAGRVTFDGTPVKGATVTLESPGSNAGFAAPLTTTSGADGEFDLGAQGAAPISIAAAAPGKTAAILFLDLRDPTLRPAPDALELQLGTCAASVFGVIVDAGGGPIPGAVIRRGPSTAVAAADGGYDLCVPLGETELTVRAGGYGTLTTMLSVSGRLHRDFRLSPEAVVTGRTVRADDGQPISGAVVRLTAASDPMQGMMARDGDAAQATTDLDGRFRLEGVVPGRQHLSAVAEGLSTTSPIDLAVDAGDSGEEVILSLAATVAVRGIVVDEAGKPVVGARVGMLAAAEGRREADRRDARSQGDGSFVIDRIVPGDHVVFVEPYDLVDDARDRRLTVPATGVADLELVVARGSSVSGVVTRAGRPVPGADVSLRGRGSGFARTEPDGRFLLRGVRPGEYSLYAESAAEGAFTNGPTISVSAGADLTGIAIELDLAGAITGVVVDQDNAPVSGAHVSFELVGGRDYGRATTADDGSFTVRGLSGGGDYAVTITAALRSSLRFAPATGDAFPLVQITDGKTHVRGVRYAVKAERLTIAGIVVDEHGTPVPDVRVAARPGEGPGFERGYDPTDVTDVSGAFAIADLIAGPYTVEARTGSGARASAPGPVEAGTRGLRLTLVAPGSVEGTLAGFSDPPHVYARPSGGSPRTMMMGELRAEVRGTTFRLRGLAPGHYTVVAQARGVAGDTAEVDVIAHETAHVALTFRGTGTISGVVTDGTTRTPAKGARCLLYRQVRRSASFTDDQGRFTIDPAPVGETRVTCLAPDGTLIGHSSVTVVANGQASVAVTLEPRRDPPLRGTIGATFTGTPRGPQVATVVDGGPAARAGIRVDDLVTSIDRLDSVPLVHVDGKIMNMVFGRMEPGTVVKLELKRGSETLEVSVTVAAP
jgi:protocatechuate 3,4-dioxygenase beta subunit